MTRPSSATRNAEGGDDPVLAHLDQAEEEYRRRTDAQDARLEQVDAARRQAEQRCQELGTELAQTRRRLEEQVASAECYRTRAKHLREMLKEVHRALFTGNVYELILRACLTLSGGTRGMYISWRTSDDTLRVRATQQIPLPAGGEPTPRIRALCERVMAERRVLVCGDGEMGDLPEAAGEAEHFRNCIVAPVVLLRNVDGIVIAADKAGGDFDESDVETLLSVGDQAAVAVENRLLQRQIQRAYLSTVTVLADAVEAKDPYTHGHCEMTCRHARLIASRMQLSAFDQSVVCYAALLHDVGKIGVSDGVLNKPGPLLPEERDLMRAHVRIGHDLLRGVPGMEEVAEVILHHHEWYDGNGYPNGLQGEQIPIGARVVAAVDAYSAMVTRRSYKEAYTDEHARNELVRFSGTQFDPDVVEAFLAILDLPEAQDLDEDDFAECGVLPGLAHIPELRNALRV